ncbi:MAG TPA: hypothetical protein VFG04_11405 [Planctomycetaceae bacterium]|jgi:hypothetical protein|nr:hypothetical protein [Planctomycetaceae bacterium]
MNRPIWGMLLVMSVILTLPGCGSDSKSDATAKSEPSSGTETPAAAGASGSHPVVHLLSENVVKRSSLEGKWILLFYERMSGMEVPAALLEISKSTSSPKLKVIVKGYGAMLQNPRLKQAVATENSLHLALEMTVQTMGPNRAPTHDTKMLDVLIDLRDGVARGTAQFEPMDSFAVMLVPSELDNIQSLRPQQLPEAVDLQGGADTTPEQALDKLIAFVHAHPDSPLTIEMYPFIFRGVVNRQLEEATVNAEAEKYSALAERWGARAGFKSRIDVATGLIPSGYLPQVALKQIDIALSQLNEERIPVWKSLLQEMKQTVISNLAMLQIRTGTPAEKTKAAGILRERLKVQPYNPLAVFEVAEYDAQQGKKQEALLGFAQVTVLPLFDTILAEIWKNDTSKPAPTPPKESAQALWKELHGGKLDGFDAYLDEVYTQSMPKFNGKRVEPRASQSDNRVVLCELFTGGDCGPCVAADLAFSQVLKTYAPSEVVALQYHEHIPHPDVLANSDTEQRFQYYFPERGGTPSFVISGKAAQAGGYLHQTAEVYKAIRSVIDLLLQRKTSVHIQLKAEPKDGAVVVTADAEGSFSATDPVRLRVVLAEQMVVMRGANGIREHEMLVRSMLGGPGGAELRAGKLHYDGKVDLKTIKRQLDDYLRAYEEANKTNFPVKPLNLSHLHLVAFVQNDQTKEVYQVATIPFPSGAAPAAAPKSQASTGSRSPDSATVSKVSP